MGDAIPKVRFYSALPYFGLENWDDYILILTPPLWSTDFNKAVGNRSHICKSENYSWELILSNFSKTSQRQGLNRDYKATQSSGQTLRESDRIACVKSDKEVINFHPTEKKKKKCVK